MKKLNLNLKLKRPSINTIIFFGVAVVIAIVAFTFIRRFIGTIEFLPIPGIAVQYGETATPDVEGNVTEEPAAPENPLPPAWDGASRVNLLFIGLDERDLVEGQENQGAPRSDTMILFTIDPQTKTAGMLSIPRDMWVNIPGFGYSRINTAYSLGEGNKLPGGGPALAMATVEQFLGVPIQYYGQINFRSFEEAIDAMGGLYLCIDEAIVIDPVGPKKKYRLEKGCKQRYGFEVLGYARNRKTQGGDVDRSKRQQEVALAIVEQMFSKKNFPNLVKNAPDIYAEAQAGIRTNLSFDDGLRLAVLLSQVPKGNIKGGVINYKMVTMDSVTLGGQAASIFKPIPDKIRVLRDEIFSTSGPLSPMASGDPVALMQADGAQVRVLNGTYTAGLAERTANLLISQGMAVTEVGNANKLYERTVIVVYAPKLYTLRYLVGQFGITANYQILFDPDPTSSADIEVRVGADWLNIIPES
jgi:LCP family protein required for cell wall assembly